MVACGSAEGGIVKSRHIEVFFAVMNHGTVTAAAHYLGITQPSVTASIKNAEADLGFKLFHRRSGRLTPTQEARILMEEVTRAHHSLDAITRIADKLKRGEEGHLRIAAAPAIALGSFADAIAEFSLESQNYSYEVTSQHGDEILRNLDERSGRYDLGFTFGVGHYDGLSYQDIGRVQLYCLMPRNWNDANIENFDLALLNELPMISTFERDPLGSAARKLLRKHNVSSTYVANVHNHQLAAALVAKRVGAAILDSLTVRYAMLGDQADGLIAYPLDEQIELPIMAVHAQQSRLTAAAERFVECMRDVLRAQTVFPSAVPNNIACANL